MTLLERAKEVMRLRSGAYKTVFRAPYGHKVLLDLAKFCRANETCFHDDPRKHAILEGRREVWLRIQEHMNMTADELLLLHPVKNLETDTNG